MTVYEVRQGAAGAGGSLPSLRAAAQIAQPGDVFNVYPGTYREMVAIRTPNTTWRSVVPHLAILDGGYSWKLGSHGGLTAAPSMPVPGPSHLPTGADSERRNAMVTIDAPGVVWEGFCIQNVAGEGVTVLEPNVTVRGCAFYCLYGTAVQCNDTAQRNTHHVTVEDCDIVWTSLRTFALGETEASGAIKFGNTGAGNRISNVRLWLAGGEGVNIGKRTKATAADPFVVEGCTLHDTNHTSLYAVQAEHVTFSGNVVVFHENVNPFTKAGRKAGAAALRIKDENSQTTPTNSRGVRFIGNLAVNGRLLIETGGDDITQYECAAYDNTLISGPYTLKGISLIDGSNDQGTEVDYQRNVVHWGRHLSDAVGIADGPRTRCTFADNYWSEAPPASHRGAGDVYGPLGLTNPDAPIVASGDAFCESWEEWQARGLVSSFDLANYRPTPVSPLVVDGAAVAGALGPDGPEPPIEPPPPGEGPDWDALRVMVVTAATRLASSQANVTEAQKHVGGAAVLLNLAMLRLADARQGQADAAAEMAALLAKMNEYAA